MDETKKTAKIGFQPRRTNEKLRKYHFSRSGKSKTGKFCISAVAEMQKMRKTGLRPWPTNQKRRKLTFGHDRKAVIH